jgi:hypothetical protein
VTTRIAPSAALEATIEELLADGLGDGERLAEIGRLGSPAGAAACRGGGGDGLPGPGPVRANAGGAGVAERESAAAGADR